MEKGEGFNNECIGDKNLKEMKQNIANFSHRVSEPVVNDTRYHRLNMVHGLQRKIIRENMHKAMSPINAISGYLELMKIFLHEDIESEKIEQYRSKIEEGVDELGEIVEKLHNLFDEKEEHNQRLSAIIELNSSTNRRAS